ncbi:hypothetical protein [Sporosarcina ureilytica]|uniref:Stage III sporulation protein AG n=1 Tax=Sporosarcina ureilytica TaxID=298596 RepID=A0A1D8JGH7_9BACL|nr:hypothetical protein [Sporosarcina ureilytica]AOV07822.1 hypothetical protein BI350_09940 [Sporosarcina ureilytica]
MTKKDALTNENGDIMQKPTKKIQTVFFGTLLVLVIMIINSNVWGIGGGKSNIEGDRREEAALEQTLMKIEGVGKVAIYYHDKDSAKEDPLSNYFSLSQTKTEKSSKPIQGILVVAEGGGDPVIQNLLSKTLATVLQLPEHQIVIVEMKNGEETE